jgi:hypothetical protein
MNEIDKAEHWQAVKAFIIPVFMFLACLIGAAGTFLIREGYMLGWAFIAASGTLLVVAFVATVTFQNKLRAKGLMQDPYDTPAPGYEEPSDVSDNDAEKHACCDHDAKPESPRETLSAK